MTRKFLVPIGLVSLSSDPAGTSAGQTYYNTTSNKIRIYNGTSWIDAGVSAQELSDAIGASVLDNTDDLTEGSTNLYYTDTRVGTYITNNLVSLQGTQGVQGIQGIIGTQGIVSGASAPANQGILWLDTTAAAETGPQGTTGTQGATGAQGTTGVGTQGTTGTTGAQGATGAQGTTGAGTQGTTGAQGATGTQGITGQNGNFGGASFDYTYSTTTAAADPGAGKIRFNNATITSATAMYIDSTNDAATDLSSFLNTIDDSTSTIKGHFRVSAKFDDSIFALFTISSLVDQTGWFTVNGSYVSGNGSFSDLADTVITFARTGDQGETGAQGATGSQGVQGITGSQGLTGLQGVVSSETAPVAQSVLWLDTTAAAETGPQGMTGGTGMTGAQGAQGATGPAVVTTKGDLATFSTVVARLPIGENNTVLTADSAEATGIKWAAPASLTLIGTSHSLSGATSTISSIPQTYKSLFMVIYGVTNATGNGVMRVAPNANTTGCSYVSTDSVGASFVSSVNRVTYLNLGTTAWLRTTTNNVATIQIDNYTSSTNYKSLNAYGYAEETGGSVMSFNIGGAFVSNTAITSLQFSNAGGNLSTGTVLLYGVN